MDGERRRLLVGTAGGLAALAGCSSPFEFGSSDPDASSGGDSRNLGDGYHAPSLEERPDGWEVTDTRRSTFEREKFGVGVKGYASTKVYEETALREAVSEKTRGQFDGRLATFFATKINLTGEATAAADVDRIAEFAKDQFEGELDNQNLRNVREVEPGGPTPDVDGEVYEYRGEYETPAISGRSTSPTSARGNSSSRPTPSQSRASSASGSRAPASRTSAVAPSRRRTTSRRTPSRSPARPATASTWSSGWTSASIRTRSVAKSSR